MAFVKAWKEIGDLPGAARGLVAVMFVNRVGAMALTFLVLFLASRGATPVEAGAMLSVYGGVSIGANLISGRLVDRLGPRRVLCASLIVGGGMLLLLPMMPSPAAITAAVVGWSLGNEGARPAGMAWLAQVTPEEQRRTAFAFSRLADNLAVGVGPALGGFLATTSYRAVFWADGLTSLAAAGLLLALAPAGAGLRPEPRRSDALPGARIDGRLLVALAGMLPIGLMSAQLNSTYPLFLVRDCGLSTTLFGAVFTVNALLVVVFEVPLTAASKGRPAGRSLAFGALLFAVGFGMLAVVRHPALVVASVLAWTAGEMLIMPVLTAYIADIAPPDRRGAYMGLLNTTFGASLVLGPAVGTWVLHGVGSSVLWSAAGLAGLISAVAFSRLDALPTRERSITAGAQT